MLNYIIYGQTHTHTEARAFHLRKENNEKNGVEEFSVGDMEQSVELSDVADE